MKIQTPVAMHGLPKVNVKRTLRICTSLAKQVVAYVEVRKMFTKLVNAVMHGFLILLCLCGGCVKLHTAKNYDPAVKQDSTMLGCPHIHSCQQK